MITNFTPHKESRKIIDPVNETDYAVLFEGYDGELVEIGVCINQGDKKYRLECHNGKIEHVTTNILSYLVDCMFRLHEGSVVYQHED